jgi:hypothetical protein
MANNIDSVYVAIWDTDIVVDKNAICDAVSELRKNADIALPYNGYCYDVPEVIKQVYFKHLDIKVLKRHTNKMKLLYEKILVGGAVFAKREKYIESGGDNENIYGWGNDDYTRFMRFKAYNYNIYRTKDHLFHLCHPRGINSRFRNSFAHKISMTEIYKEIELNPFKVLI